MRDRAGERRKWVTFGTTANSLKLDSTEKGQRWGGQDELIRWNGRKWMSLPFDLKDQWNNLSPRLNSLSSRCFALFTCDYARHKATETVSWKIKTGRQANGRIPLKTSILAKLTLIAMASFVTSLARHRSCFPFLRLRQHGLV